MKRFRKWLNKKMFGTDLLDYNPRTLNKNVFVIR